jgi:hypothetical protein
MLTVTSSIDQSSGCLLEELDLDDNSKASLATTDSLVSKYHASISDSLISYSLMLRLYPMKLNIKGMRRPRPPEPR